MGKDLSRKDIINALDDVPMYQEFKLVRELYESSKLLEKKHGDIVERIEVGPSRADMPVEALIIHGGDTKRVLAYAFPHPNEPIGSLTLDFLSEFLVSNRDWLRKLDATWIIVKVADVYGALLNEGWFKGPFTLEKYFTNYYRPPPYKQVEWTFPIEYKTLNWDKPLPETKSLMKIIDEWKPTHIYSLHNSFFSGTYYYVSKRPSQAALELLTKFPSKFGVPLHQGQPEAPYMEKHSEAVFSMVSIIDEYDWLEKNSDKDPAEILIVGTNSYDYARRENPDVFALICEVPYIYDERLNNNTPIGLPKRDIYRVVLEKSWKSIEEFKEYVNDVSPYITDNNPYFEPVANYVKFIDKRREADERWVESDETLKEQATVAEAVHSQALLLWEVMALYGRTKKAISYEMEKGRKIPKDLDGKADEKLKAYIKAFEKTIEYKIMPINNLVKIQLTAILSTLSNL